LSHASSPCCFSYFSNRVSYPGVPVLQSSYLCFPQSWDDWCVLPSPGFYWLRCSLQLFAQAGLESLESQFLPPK
jgi:hypothetical protein